MKRLLRWTFALFGFLFLLVVISYANRPTPPGLLPSPTAAAPSQPDVVMIPAAPTNPYLSLSPERLFAHARDLDRRMVAANRPNPKAGTPLVTNREIDETQDALSAIPKTGRQYRLAQHYLRLRCHRSRGGQQIRYAPLGETSA